MRRPLFLLAAALGLAACERATDPFDADECPPPAGEFPPTDCALVEGRLLNALRAPAAGIGVRVDSVLRGIGYAYTADGATTDNQGRFRLTVMRVNRFQPPTTPDTATVEIKLYQRQNPPPGSTPFGAVAVRMSFAPLGEPVEPTSAELAIP